MKKRTEKRQRSNGMRPEYDFSKLEGGVRGKYLTRYRAGTNLVLLSPDVAAHFPNEKAVNAALRALIQETKGPVAALADRALRSITSQAHLYKRPRGKRLCIMAKFAKANPKCVHCRSNAFMK